MTPLDIAGKHRSDDAAIILLNYFISKSEMIKTIYGSKGKSKTN